MSFFKQKNQGIRTFKLWLYTYLSKVILKREEKEKLVIQLAEAGKTTRHIAQVAHISLKDIGTIIRKYTGEDRIVKAVKNITILQSLQTFQRRQELGGCCNYLGHRNR